MNTIKIIFVSTVLLLVHCSTPKTIKMVRRSGWLFLENNSGEKLDSLILLGNISLHECSDKLFILDQGNMRNSNLGYFQAHIIMMMIITCISILKIAFWFIISMAIVLE
jgi:hypothetical protein